MLLGFFDDYNRIVVNAKHELILRRANTEDNAIMQTEAEELKISLVKMEWLLPHIRVADHIKEPLLNLIKADKTLTLPFRTWTLYEYPMLPTTTRHVWAVKTSSALEKPRFVILGFQTNRQNKDQNASHFDHAKLCDVKLYLSAIHTLISIWISPTTSLLFSTTCIPTSNKNITAKKRSRSFPEVNF